ncbi:hypothetical protein F4811DRAFT_546873 [Daldinia bambusicola]|nr:hypothetical protein F4811DRAFT_546873 [Daldinia bambusicola]
MPPTMARGNFRRGRPKRIKPQYHPPAGTEYEESQEGRDYLNEDYAYANPSNYNGFTSHYYPPPGYAPRPNAQPPLSKQPAQADSLQQPPPFVRQNKRQNGQHQQGQQRSQGEAGVHYHHHNHYYHLPNGPLPFPMQTATGRDNDIIMTDYSEVNVLENRLSGLGAEIREFLQAMSNQNNQTMQLVNSFVGFLKQSRPDSELYRVLATDNPQGNAIQLPQQNAVQPPAAPPVAPPVAPIPTQPAVAPSGATTAARSAFKPFPSWPLPATGTELM